MAFIGKHISRVQENKRRQMDGMARNGVPGQFLQLKHGLTYYELDDTSDKPLLICIHGWTTASYVWEPLKPLLREKGYRLLTYDLYGRGFSDRRLIEHSAELFTNQLTELLDRLGLNNEPMSVVGYSMGGAIAARFVSERLTDIERLLLLAPAGMEVRAPSFRRIARNRPKLFDPHLLTLVPLALRIQFRNAAKGFEGDPVVQNILHKQNRELEYQGYLPALLSSLTGVLASKMEAEHRKIARSNVPVRAIFAGQDKTIPSPDAMNLFNRWNHNSASREIEEVGHAVTYTHPDQIMKEAEGFL